MSLVHIALCFYTVGLDHSAAWRAWCSVSVCAGKRGELLLGESFAKQCKLLTGVQSLDKLTGQADHSPWHVGKCQEPTRRGQRASFDHGHGHACS